MKSRTQRIVVGACSFADAERAVRLVGRISQPAGTELCGILFDEGVSSDLTALPGQMVVTPGGQLIPPPSAGQLTVRLKADARAFRDLLSDVATGQSLSWTFEIRNGTVINQLRGAVGQEDILILGHREMNRSAGCVIHIAAAAQGSKKAARLASELSSDLNTKILNMRLILVGEQSGDLPRNGADTASESELKKQLNQINSSAVIIDPDVSEFVSEQLLSNLLEVARCPVFLFGPAQKHAES